MSELTEADRYLLERIRQGDAEGWSQLVGRYQGRLLAFARTRVRSAGDIEDLVQDTFISFLKAVGDYREQASLETYLFTILRRKIIDTFRGRKVNVCLLQDVLPAGGEDEAADPAGQLASSDPTASWYARRDEEHVLQGEALTQALREVIDGYKQSVNFRDLQIVEMVFYGHFRNKDVAEMAGVDEKHVAMIKHRCLKRIRECVSPVARGFESDPPDALLSRIWQEQRLSCLKRSTIGAYLLGTLEPPWPAYIAFHLDRLGCQFCRANLDDLKARTAQDSTYALRDRILQSTVGFLKMA